MLHIPLSIFHNLPFSRALPPPLYLNSPPLDYLSTLPQELIERILDHLQNSRRSLLACALTSPALLAGARHHLFYTTNLSSEEACYTICKRLPSAPGALAHVHDLRVRLPTSPWADEPEPEWFAELELPALHGLHVLRLEGVRGVSFRGPRLCGWARIGLGVRKLVLTSCVFEDPKDMQGLLGAFPALDDLSFDGWFPYCGEGSANEEYAPHDGLHLHNLTLPAAGTRGAQHLLQWLSSGAHAKTRLRALHTLVLHGAPEQPILDEFFAQTSIQDLRVVLSGQFPETYPDLSLLPTIRTFTLSLPASPDLTPFLVSLLEPLHDAPVLHRVHITLSAMLSSALSCLGDFSIAPLALALAPLGGAASGHITLECLIHWHPDPAPVLVPRASADMPYMGGRKYAMRVLPKHGTVPDGFGKDWLEGMRDAVERAGGVQVKVGWEVVGKDLESTWI